MVLESGSRSRPIMTNRNITLFFSLAGSYIRLLLVIISVLSISGCSRQTRHQTLTFFFTGVPPLEEKRTEHSAAFDSPPNAKEQSGKTTEKSQETLPSGQQKTSPIVPAVPQLFSHTVWDAGDCSPCHEGIGTFGFKAAEKPNKRTTKLFNSGGGMPGKLRHPKEKICTTCHTDKSGLRAIKENLWLHNSTAKGDCLACHDAHQSEQRGVLRRPVEQLCQPCHPAKKLELIPMHNDSNEPCLSCHNPHMGKDRNLLIQDYQEVKQDVKREL